MKKNDQTVPPWRREEKIIVSCSNYLSSEECAQYESRMKTVRDIDGENLDLLDRLRLPVGARILEIGTGTGLFARAAAKRGLNVVAVDVSDAMIDAARRKAQEEGISTPQDPHDGYCMTGTIDFRQEGFLSFDDTPESFDAVVSSLALHHLPDVWKAEAVVRIARALKPGGLFLLVDVVFDCKGGELDDYLAQTIPEEMNSLMKQKLYDHVKLEFSCFHWIMKGILEQAGLEIQEFEKFGMFGHLYKCVKPAAIDSEA